MLWARLLGLLILFISLIILFGTFREYSKLSRIGHDEYNAVGIKIGHAEEMPKYATKVVIESNEVVLLSKHELDASNESLLISERDSYRDMVSKLWGENLTVYVVYPNYLSFFLGRILTILFLILMGCILWKSAPHVANYDWRNDPRDYGGDGGL